MRKYTSGRMIAALAASGLLAACGNENTDTPAGAVGDTPRPAPAADLPRTASPEGASVFFITPADGDVVSNPVRVEFGVSGMEVVKAGEQRPASGHHHLIIDAGLPELDTPIPANDHYVHFGDASTSTELRLEPGRHTLQLLFGDYLHVPHDPPVMSEAIAITVE